MELPLGLTALIIVLAQVIGFFVLGHRRLWTIVLAGVVSVVSVYLSLRTAGEGSVPGFILAKHLSVSVPIILYLLGNWLHAGGRLSPRARRGFEVAFHVVFAVNCLEAVVTQGLKHPSGWLSWANVAAGAVLVVLIPRRWSFGENSQLGFDDGRVALLYILWNIAFVLDIFPHKPFIVLSVSFSNVFSFAWAATRGGYHSWFLARATTLFIHLFIAKLLTLDHCGAFTTSAATRAALLAATLVALVWAIRGRLRGAQAG